MIITVWTKLQTKRFLCISPWITEDNVFLHFSFVKCIWNNWISEKSGELEFSYQGKNYVAKWDQIRKLQKLEDRNLVKMSKLTYVAGGHLFESLLQWNCRCTEISSRYARWKCWWYCYINCKNNWILENG